MCGLILNISAQIPEQSLGYNPQISAIPYARLTDKTPVITVLGFPDPLSMYKGKFDTEKTFTVTFAFQNTVSLNWVFNPFLLAKSLGSINFGQEIDARALLYTVIECYKKGYPKVYIFANSRGGAATITMLDMLSHPENHLETWSLFKIHDQKTQEAIRTMVGNGSIVLAHPLMHYNVAVKKSIANAVNVVYPFLGRAYIQEGTYTCAHNILKYFTSFNFTYLSPIEALAKSISNNVWPYHVTIALAEQDSIVGHEHEPVLHYVSLLHPEKLTIIKGGKGHTDIRQCLRDAREYWTQ